MTHEKMHKIAMSELAMLRREFDKAVKEYVNGKSTISEFLDYTVGFSEEYFATREAADNTDKRRHKC